MYVEKLVRDAVASAGGEVVRERRLPSPDLARALSLSFGGAGLVTMTITDAEISCAGDLAALVAEKVRQAKATCLEGDGRNLGIADKSELTGRGIGSFSFS